MAFAPVQRMAVGAMAVALLTLGPWVGWWFLIPLAVSVVGFAILKNPRVHTRLGVATSWLSWGLGVLGTAAIVVMMDTPPQYVLSLITVPTMLGCTVFPTRLIPLLAAVTALATLAAGWLADPDAFTRHPAPVVVTALVLPVFVLFTAIARGAETQSHEASQRDPLTGAYNRLALSTHLSAVTGAAERRPWALIVTDIDNFKQINDRLGHAAGDDVLRAVALHVRDRLPADAAVYRLGGEEFLVSVYGDDADRAVELAETLRSTLRVTAGDVPVTMSFGVARAPSSEPERFDTLFSAADVALYRAKASGRDTVQTADPDTSFDRSPVTGDERPERQRRDPQPVRASRSGIIREPLEREQLLDMMARQYRSTRISDLLVIVPLVLFAKPLGYGTALLAIATIALIRIAQRTAPRLRRPEILLGGAWLLGLALVGVLVAFTGEPAPWGLWAPSVLIVASSAAFPWRFARWGALAAGLITIAAALALDGRVFSNTPEAVVSPLCLLFANVLIAREIGRRILGMRRAAVFDQLTGLPNRAVFDRRIAQTIDDAAADGGAPVGLIMIDIDHFKQVNDAYGHSRGDAVLISVASQLQSRLRHDGTLFRIGGEEFAVMLTGDHARDAADIAERLRRSIREHPLAGVPITMSFGVSVATAPVGVIELFTRADRALYEAKAERDRVRIAGDWPPTAAPQVTQAPAPQQFEPLT